MPLLKKQKQKPTDTFDPVSGKRNRFVNNQRIVKEDQVDPEILKYCEVNTRKYDALCVESASCHDSWVPHTFNGRGQRRPGPASPRFTGPPILGKK